MWLGSCTVRPCPMCSGFNIQVILTTGFQPLVAFHLRGDQGSEEDRHDFPFLRIVELFERSLTGVCAVPEPSDTSTEWWYLCGRVRARFGLVPYVWALTFKSTSWSTCVLQGSARCPNLQSLQTQDKYGVLQWVHLSWGTRSTSSPALWGILPATGYRLVLARRRRTSCVADPWHGRCHFDSPGTAWYFSKCSIELLRPPYTTVWRETPIYYAYHP